MISSFSTRAAIGVAFVLAAAPALAQETLTFAGAPCVTAPPMKCPEADCPGDRIANQGSVVEMKTRRTYFLDYPCDLKKGEKVTFTCTARARTATGSATTFRCSITRIST